MIKEEVEKVVKTDNGLRMEAIVEEGRNSGE
jgi:hypothetical protein